MCDFLFGGDMKENQEIVIKDKNRVEIDSILSVRSFDEDGIVVESSLGLVSVEGSGLRIENFEKSTTQILVTGDIYGVFYLKNRDKKKGRIVFK